MRSRKEMLAMLMTLAGNAIFGFSFLFSKLAMETAEPVILLAVRFLTAFAVLHLLKVLRVMKCDLRGKRLGGLILLGIYQPVLYFLCESYGIRDTASSFAGVVIALAPIAGLVLGSLILKERPTILQVLFSLLSVTGVITATVTGGVDGFRWRGFLFLLGAVFSGSMFTIQSRSIAGKFTAFERTYVMFGMGAVFFLLLALLRSAGNPSMWIVPLTSGKFWISIVYLGGVSSVGAFLLLNRALDDLDVTRSLVFANVTTVISVLAGVLLLHEAFSAVQAVGIAMVLIGVYGVNRKTNQ